MKTLAALLLSFATICPAQDESAARLLSLSGLKFVVERVGTFTFIHCDDPKNPDCALFEKLQLQPDTDWASVIAKAKKPGKRKLSGPLPVLAKANVVDQHGGMWIIALLPPHNGRPAGFLGDLTYVVVPDFPGYRVAVNDQGAVTAAEVVINKAEWARAVEAQPKPKKGLARILD